MKPTVLILEEDDELRDLLRLCITSAIPCRALTASTVDEVIDLGGDVRLDAIVAGSAFAQLILPAVRHGRSIPTVVLTESGDAGTLHWYLDLGASSVLPPGFAPVQLVDMLRGYLAAAA